MSTSLAADFTTPDPAAEGAGGDLALAREVSAAVGEGADVTPPLSDFPFKSGTTRALVSFWLGLRGTDRVAAWDRFDPLDVAPLLPRMVIGELTGPDTVIARLVGVDIVALYGADFTGANLIALDGQPDSDGFRDMYRRLSLGTCAYAAEVVYGTLKGVEARCEFVNLPMICAQGRVTRVLISVAPLWGPQPVEGLDGGTATTRTARRVEIPL